MSIKAVDDTPEGSAADGASGVADEATTASAASSELTAEASLDAPPAEAEPAAKKSGRGWMWLSIVLAILLLLGLWGNGYQMAQQADLHAQLAATSATSGQLEGQVDAMGERVAALQATLAELLRLQAEAERVTADLDSLGIELAALSDPASQLPAVAAGPPAEAITAAAAVFERLREFVQWVSERAQALADRARAFMSQED